MLTKDGSLLLCTKEAVIQTAQFMGGLYRVWDQGDEFGRNPSLRYEDSQTGGGAVRMSWRDGICWISRHGGYQVDRCGEAFEVLTILFGATVIEGDRYHPNQVTMDDFCWLPNYKARAVNGHVEMEPEIPWSCRNFS